MKKQPKISKEVLALRHSKAYRKAYLDPEFLTSDELRPVRLQLELQKPEMTLAAYGVKSTVVCFGSARILDKEQSSARVAEMSALLKKNPKDSVIKNKLGSAKRLKASARYYEVAREFGKLISKTAIQDRKLVVVTGGGPGIMEAANRGAHEAGEKSIGLNITLEMEQGPNPYVSPEFCFRFHYFAIRKMHFVMRARALVVFPGLMGAAVGRFHDAWPAACHHHQFAVLDHFGLRDEPAEVAGHFVISGGGFQPFGRAQLVLYHGILGMLLLESGHLGHAGGGLLLVQDTGAAETHHGGFNAVLGQRHLGLLQFELKAHRAQLVAGEEFRVQIGFPVCLRMAES